MPEPQDNLKRATALAFDALQRQTAEQMVWLGATRRGNLWRLPVMNDAVDVDLAARRVTTSAGREVNLAWCVLLLHYLAIQSRPELLAAEIVFADLPTARMYARVYHQRAIGRLCATVGRDVEKLRGAATTLGGRAVAGGDAAFEFDVLPRLRLRLIWHAADEEFSPSATLLLSSNIESYFCIEDIVVLSERLVGWLAGRGL
jgi:hypothetical protein